jgi:mannose-6-phosphate isomerase-like protein (cupin superfamily)
MRSMVRGTLMGLALVVLGVGGLTMAQEQGAGGGGRGGAGGGGGQRPPAVAKLYSSASDIQAMIAKAKMDAKPGQAIVNGSILRLVPDANSSSAYAANLEYRPMAGAAAVHVREAEVFYVIDGSCTFVTGGKLTEPKQTNAENLSGTAIEGGTTTTLSKGDFMVVPENTPHQVTAVNPVVVFMTLHVPRPGATASTSAAPGN